MDNETIKILEEQAGKLPKEVIDFLSSSGWESALNNISASFNLSSELSNELKREVVLVLAGLIHPDDFREEIKKRIGGDETTLDSIVAEIEEKIFAPIRADLVKFFEEQEELEKKEAEQASSQIPAKTLEKMPDVVPDNLPVGEEENEKLKTKNEKIEIETKNKDGKQDEGEISPFPPLIPKTRPGGDEINENLKTENEKQEETHPFEEKMKKVFTGSPATTEDLSIETPAQEKNISIESDPYREPVE